ncbi:MAG: Mu-like prophage major head subunit gpT family protein [Chthonomonas sp.]|nr:Mu-like prophage major head subunit gpT family protein [Chthonomonas sp.]
MAITKSDIPALLLPGLRAEFHQAYRSEVDLGLADRLATVINTTLPMQRYAWLGAPPPMREFIDERQPGGLSSYATAIEDKVFEASIGVDRKALEDDQLDLIRIRIRDLAFRVATHRTQLVIEALLTGNTQLGSDGVAFFGSAHPQGAGTLSNISADDLAEASLTAAINAMMILPDDVGVPLGILPDTLVVGPKNQWLASELVQSPVVRYAGNAVDTAASTPYVNALYGKLNVVVTPFIAGTNEDRWYLLDTKRPMRGVILQQRSDVPVEFTAMEGSDSESGWMRDRFYYGVRGRYNVGYGLWQTAFGGGY